ncbi:unnamed protein product [Periconia digitata]|uniref:DUF967 domain protein n=1 Tax=Periconia digitata TaxID=1303443 RepID=A0A9W4UBR6_9PLEO|nr:unnamed protein product [Periconia digitata]
MISLLPTNSPTKPGTKTKRPAAHHQINLDNITANPPSNLQPQQPNTTPPVMADSLAAAPQDLESIKSQTAALLLPHFTANDAFTLGCSLRTRIQSLYPNTPAVINITHSNTDSLLFHCATGSGIQPDNDIWVARKRRTVKRWGVSSWFMGRKFNGDEEEFKRKYALGETAGEYAIHGGAVPVRVKGVEGTVAVVIVSGLKQDEDHMVVVEGLERFIAECEGRKG